jgi:hypothetical protein
MSAMVDKDPDQQAGFIDGLMIAHALMASWPPVTGYFS